MDSWVFKADHLRLKQYLRRCILLPTQLNLTTIRQYIISLHFILLQIIIVSFLVILQLTSSFFNFSNYFKFGRRMEFHSVLSQKKQQVFCYVSTGQVDSFDCMWKTKSLENWDNVGDAITAIQYNPGGFGTCISMDVG